MTNKFALMRSIIMCIVFSAFRTVHVYPTLTIWHYQVFRSLGQYSIKFKIRKY